MIVEESVITVTEDTTTTAVEDTITIVPTAHTRAALLPATTATAIWSVLPHSATAMVHSEAAVHQDSMAHPEHPTTALTTLPPHAAVPHHAAVQTWEADHTVAVHTWAVDVAEVRMEVAHMVEAHMVEVISEATDKGKLRARVS